MQDKRQMLHKHIKFFITYPVSIREQVRRILRLALNSNTQQVYLIGNLFLFEDKENGGISKTDPYLFESNRIRF